ncbi:hypothetical protein ADIARSV_0590 [Arcticibacter svalbardensis MN12-7]|uniref:Uncharacterized protein n=1 Tax=Arcticibacter svalbardensis MN12-7 TaxID=1150600 RepID=R9GXH4_9SPHI|nr:hypothetical protein [Arcticibacter svalbardensis]EOR96185.1 hypothetical protein ADIARSV_0590 [Arcticibacter svalbardensis MN12-7]
MLKPKRSVTPEKAIEILKKHGTIISKEEAEKILQIMYDLAKLVVEEQLRLKKQL